MKYLLDVDDEEVAVDEGEACNIVSTFEFDGETFNKDGLLSIKLTLFDLATREIINSRDEQNIFDTNGGTVSADGELVIELGDLDNIIIGTIEEGTYETHVAKIVWTFNSASGVRTGIEELAFYVRKTAVL